MTLKVVSGTPDILNQVLTVSTGYGAVARCGCGWRSIHDSKIQALVAGQRHTRTHSTEGDTE